MSGRCFCTPQHLLKFLPYPSSHPLAEHFHHEVIQVVVRQPTGHHNLRAFKQLVEVVCGQEVHCVFRITQVYV